MTTHALNMMSFFVGGGGVVKSTLLLIKAWNLEFNGLIAKTLVWLQPLCLQISRGHCHVLIVSDWKSEYIHSSFWSLEP